MSYQINGTYGTMYYTSDRAKTVRFYKEVMKLKPRFESPEWTEFDVNGHGLCLHSTNGQPKGDTTQGILILDVKNINEMRTALVSQGVEFISEVKPVHPGAFCTDFKDPNGNVVSLYEDTNRK